jgi:hypothetical protein
MDVLPLDLADRPPRLRSALPLCCALAIVVAAGVSSISSSTGIKSALARAAELSRVFTLLPVTRAADIVRPMVESLGRFGVEFDGIKFDGVGSDGGERI